MCSAKQAAMTAIAVVIPCLSACRDPDPMPLGLENPAFALAPPAPPGLVDVAYMGSHLRIWPFTGLDLAGTASDPVNLLFTGHAGVVSLRAALLSLDGDRSAFGLPAVPPFDCTWSDAYGDIQTAYSDGEGWVGNPVQLQCGKYDPLRIHVRLFPAGDWVAGAAHFELLIPQTTEHEILSWELAEALVTIDFVRSGFLAAPPSAALIGPAPAFRETRAAVYNLLPQPLVDLLALFNGPQPPRPVAADVPLAADGMATILDVVAAPIEAATTTSSFTLPFDQVIPRPFCATGPADLVLLRGTVDFSLQVSVSSAGVLSSHGSVSGQLGVTPIDLFTMTPSGDPFRALVSNRIATGAGPAGSHTEAIIRRLGLPPADEGHGSFMSHLVTSPNGGATFTLRERC